MKKIIIVCLILLLALPTYVCAYDNLYLNNEKHIAYISGYPDGTVRPNAFITRAETATIISKLLKTDVEKTDEIINYSDVKEQDWYFDAISTVVRCGLMKGDGEAFFPEKFITRAEIAVICSRMYNSDSQPADVFSDVVDHWAEDYINEVAGLSIINGYDNNMFKPDNYITRAELITVINKMLGRVPETVNDLYSDMKKWSDNEVHQWYYLQIQEATNKHDYRIKENGFEKWITDDNEQWTKPIK